MAFTTNWMWRVIDRRKDYSISQGVESFRENWTLSRYRISDQAYSSELGDTSTSLAAENGGVTETITAPTDTTHYRAYNWDFTDDVPWYSSGYTRNGRQAYIYSEPSPVDSSKSAVMFYEVHFDAGIGSGQKYWWMTQCSASEATSGTFPVVATAISAGDCIAWSEGTTSTPPTAWVRYQNTDPFNVAATTEQIDFRCTSDAQSYAQKFVDWFTQTQTWVIKSPWV